MYEQSVSSTTNSPPGQRDSGSSNLRLGGVGPHSTGGGMPQGQLPLSHQQNLAEYSWNSLPQQSPSYPTGAMLQQGPSPPQQTHLQLNLPGPLPPLQAPGPGGQGSFWGSGAGSKESPLSQHQHSPSTSISSSRGGHDSYRQMLHPDEMNSDDELDSSFHSGPSSTTPEVPETSTKKKKGIKICSLWLFWVIDPTFECMLASEHQHIKEIYFQKKRHESHILKCRNSRNNHV